MREGFLCALASVTRRFHPRGTERILRLIHDPGAFGKPGAPRPIEGMVRLPNGCLLLTKTSSFLEWLVFFKGDYEPDMTRLIQRLLRPGDVAIDVGANVGVHTLTMSRAVGENGRVIACEPHPGILDRLLQNLTLNSIKNVRVEPVAMTDKPGTVEFFVADPSAPNQAVSSLLADADETLLAKPMMVQAKTLDQIANELEKPVRLIKIDVEGAEPMALRGGLSLLRRNKPTVIFEYCRPKWQPAGFDLESVLGEFRALSYSDFRSVTAHGFAPFDPKTLDFANIIALTARDAT